MREYYYSTLLTRSKVRFSVVRAFKHAHVPYIAFMDVASTTSIVLISCHTQNMLDEGRKTHIHCQDV